MSTKLQLIVETMNSINNPSTQTLFSTDPESGHVNRVCNIEEHRRVRDYVEGLQKLTMDDEQWKWAPKDSQGKCVLDDEKGLQHEIYGCCQFAVERQNISVFETLYHEIKNNEFYLSSLFYQACDVGCIDIMSFLIRHGISISTFSSELKVDCKSPLLLAVDKGNLQVVRFLCSYNDLDTTVGNNYGMTAAMLAAKNENSVCLDILIKCGHDVTMHDKSGNTALHHLCFALKRSNKSLECLKLLINSGCDVDVRNKYGDTAVQVALVRHHKELVHVLVSKNCSISGSEFRAIPCLNKLCSGTSYSIIRQGFIYEFNGDSWCCKGIPTTNDNSRVTTRDYKAPTAFCSLKDACRFEIRKVLGVEVCYKVSKLALPEIIQNFILLKDVLPEQCFQ